MTTYEALSLVAQFGLVLIGVLTLIVTIGRLYKQKEITVLP
ncbi:MULTISPECIES: putative holin-like toxin [Bacillus]|nr:putative holin-like toxin [Bacillus smithii]